MLLPSARVSAEFDRYWNGGWSFPVSLIDQETVSLKAVTALLFLAILWQHGPTLHTLLYWVFAAGLVAAAADSEQEDAANEGCEMPALVSIALVVERHEIGDVQFAAIGMRGDEFPRDALGRNRA